MKRRKKIGKALAYVLFVLVSSAGLLELIYRRQWMDFYQPEWKGLNPEALRKGTKPDILVAGDSFTATDSGYVQLLRDSLPGYDVLNAAVPGTGIVQARYILRRRIQQVKPSVFIYQVYTGNDLFDIRHPHSGKISLMRSAYWWIADRWRILPFINYRMAGIRYRYYDDAGGQYKAKLVEAFSPQHYSRRERFNFTAEPSLIENSLYLESGRHRDMLRWKHIFRSMNRLLPADCKKYLLVLPHCAQVSPLYRERMEQTGARFSHHPETDTDYPMYAALQEAAWESGFILINPLQSMRRAEAEGSALYYANDPHLNPRGQQLVGREVYHQLQHDVHP